MHWDLIQTALGEAFKNTTGLPVFWLDEKPEMGIFNNACGRGTLSITVPAALGVDDIRYTETAGAPAGKELTRHICGNRTFTLNAKVDTFDHSEARAAWYYLERFRTLLFSSGLREKLRAVGVSLARTGPIVSLNRALGSRIVSSAALDVIMSAAVTLEDCKETYIEKVLVSSNILDAEGNPISATIQLQNEEMP